jgi:glycosyltransferase involved in cell wall biosynthesis
MRLAFVIPWLGPALKGGAEQQAWQLATRLASRGHTVDGLTTCCQSFLDDWATNHLPEGKEEIQGVAIRRFLVDGRNRSAFDELNGELLAIPKSQLRPGISPVSIERARIWTEQNINSRQLEDYLGSNASRYDAIIFIPYLYGPTLRGLPLVADKAWMQPCLHDEAYAYLPEAAKAMHAARGILFNSLGEQELAARLFGPAMWSKGKVAGGGVEFGPLNEYCAATLPSSLQAQKYFLFLGRREAGKGVDLIIEAFRIARRRSVVGDFCLVLAGPGNKNYGAPDDGVVDLGLVGEETRVALLRDCIALVLPSPNESLSRVLYEAWYSGRPAIVRRCCDATRLPVEECDGGWVAEDVSEWSDRLTQLASEAANDGSLSSRGARGREYALRVADWERVMERYEAILAPAYIAKGADSARTQNAGREFESLRSLRELPGAPKGIHQLSPNLGYGDAISGEMLELRRMLLEAGFRSNIYATFVDPRVEGQAIRHMMGVIPPEDGLIYHHSIGAAVTEAAIDHRGPKGLIYHNITPAEYFRPYRPEFARILRDGREDLWLLARKFKCSVGDSRFNAAELERYGFRAPGILPLVVDPIAWDQAPTQSLLERLSDGRKNILFVGRVAPNKRQDRLVEAFSLVRAVMDARLILAGSAPEGDPYADHVRALVRSLELDDDVILTGHCSTADLHAFYRSADLFWSFSEHEGFCVPIIEAMWFDIPVLAMASSAVSETLAGAGFAFSWGDENSRVAATACRMLADIAIESRIRRGQRSRRAKFVREEITPALEQFVNNIVEQYVEGAVAAHE